MKPCRGAVVVGIEPPQELVVGLARSRQEEELGRRRSAVTMEARDLIAGQKKKNEFRGDAERHGYVT